MLHSLKKSTSVSYQKLRKLFYVKDFVTLIRPYIFIISVLGYFPYSISLSTYKVVKKSFVWSWIMLISMTVLCLAVLPRLTFWNRHRDIISRLDYANMYGFGLFCLWASYFSSRSKLHFLRTVSTASRVLSLGTFCSTAKWMFVIDIIKVTPLLTHVVVVEANLWSIVIYASCCYISLEALIANSLFINSLYVLRLCFRNINRSLEKLRINLVTDEPHLLRRVYHSQNNPTLLSELKTLRRQHLELGKIVDASNETFGLEIIFIIARSMMTIILNLYRYLIENTDDGKIVHLWSMYIEYLVHTCQYLIVIAVVCEMVKDQAKNIGYNIHRILVTTFDKQISTELSSFSMEVLQQNHAIVARGLIIDVTLLTKIVGIITTYLLILIQFSLMKPC
ncbi:uncharacterized protein LOC117226043 [Megalopta genalis]|uniref:uncharacterized protein LOC117226043 n=1 Tax=Megalopta genalis TaxID=115081 RepID=UPI003FD6643F